MRCNLWAKPSLRTIHYLHSITCEKACLLLLHYVKPLMSNLWIAVFKEHTDNSDITMHANTRRHEKAVFHRGDAVNGNTPPADALRSPLQPQLLPGPAG